LICSTRLNSSIGACRGQRSHSPRTNSWPGWPMALWPLGQREPGPLQPSEPAGLQEQRPGEGGDGLVGGRSRRRRAPRRPSGWWPPTGGASSRCTEASRPHTAAGLLPDCRAPRARCGGHRTAQWPRNPRTHRNDATSPARVRGISNDSRTSRLSMRGPVRIR
jgi:hypothetical protein